MSRLTHDPPLPRRASPTDSGFVQRIELHDGRRLVGRAVWHLWTGGEGVVQIIELTVEADARRQGHAGALLNEAIAQARALCKLRGCALRRVWVPLGHKSQVVARAFLTKHGFHHTSTIPDLFRDEDLLVYIRSFD